MIGGFLTTSLMPNGYYKVVVQGHADGHTMDWRGCNYRFISVRGQPHKGFLEEAQAETYLRLLSEEVTQAEIDRAGDSVGTAWP